MGSQVEIGDVESQVLVWNHKFGVVNSLVLKCAVKLNIFDTIHRHGTPITLSELGASLSVPPANLAKLGRILRYLAHMRMVKVIVDNQHVVYALAPAGKLLLKGDEQSLAPHVKLMVDEGFLSPLHALDSCVHEDADTSCYDRVKGESLWGLMSRDAESNKLFNEGMASGTAKATAGLVEACRETFEGIRTLVDVGGGTGTTARAIVGVFPHIKCTVLDLPQVVEGLPRCQGIDFVAGDMFSYVPPADVVLIKTVFHNWNDEECLKILKLCKEAIPKNGGKLLIVDIVISDRAPEEDEFYNTKLAYDMTMMAVFTGRERTEKEWKELLVKAGFSGCKITPIKTIQHVIEAHP